MAALQPGGIQAAAAAKRQRGADPVAAACHRAAGKSNNEENLGDVARAKELNMYNSRVLSISVGGTHTVVCTVSERYTYLHSKILPNHY